MSIIVKDSNEYNAKELFDSRESYKKDAYSFIDEKHQAVLYEHFFENQYFGKIDSAGNSIFPSEKFLKGIKSTQSNFVFAQDFAAKAFTDMADYYLQAFRRRKILTEGTAYPQLQPFGGFSSLHKNYTNYLSKFNLILLQYLKDERREKEVLKFEDFIKYFINFLKLQKGLIIFTRTKFIKSKLVPLTSSGLSITLAPEEFDNDLKKYNEYVRDRNFLFFLECARRFSFYVDKNAPWMLHFDFNNPYSKKYLRDFNLQDADDVYQKRFYKSYFTDIKILKDFLHHSYTALRVNDSFVKFVVDVTDCQEPILEKVVRPQTSLSEIKTKFPDSFWIKLYFDIRLIEEGVELPKAKYDKIVVDSENILKYGVVPNDRFKFESAVTYINNSLIKLEKRTPVEQAKKF